MCEHTHRVKEELVWFDSCFECIMGEMTVLRCTECDDRLTTEVIGDVHVLGLRTFKDKEIPNWDQIEYVAALCLKKDPRGEHLLEKMNKDDAEVVRRLIRRNADSYGRRL